MSVHIPNLVTEADHYAEFTNRSVFEGWNYDDIRTLRFNPIERTICTTLGAEEDVLDHERKAFQTIFDNVTIDDRDSDENFEESKFFLAGFIYNQAMLLQRINMRIAMQDNEFEYVELELPKGYGDFIEFDYKIKKLLKNCEEMDIDVGEYLTEYDKWGRMYK